LRSGVASEGLVAIGQIVGAFGIWGEVKVLPLTDFPERFLTTKRVYLGSRSTEAVIASARPHEKAWLVSFEGISARDAAEKLRSVYIMIPEKETVPLEQDRYYVFELVGCQVFSQEGERLGEIRDATTGTGNDLLVISRPGGKESLVPFAREFVKLVDLDCRRVVLAPIPGLLE